MDRATRRDYAFGFGAGLVAFGASAVSIALLVRIEGPRFWRPLLPLWTGGPTELLAWTIYSVHFVGTTGPTYLAFGENNLIFYHLQTSVPLFVYYLVPPVTLVIAGYVVVRRSSREFARRRLLPVSGAVGAGYGVLPLLGAFAVQIQLERGLLATIDPGYTVLLIGLGYPLLFGTIGGILATEK